MNTKLITADYQRHQAQIIAVREAVFIIEQGVPVELEVDEQDPLSHHVLLFYQQQAIATGRLTPTGHIGRLSVLKPFRQQGYGSQLIKKLEQLALQLNLSQVKLGAQIQAIAFYEKLGYRAYGDIFMDAGIAHRMMKKALV